MFFATISAEILRICQATSFVVQFIKTSKVFLHRMLRQGEDPLDVKKVLNKMINHHALQFGKYNTSNRDLIQQLNLLILLHIYNLYLICVDVYVCQF